MITQNYLTVVTVHVKHRIVRGRNLGAATGIPSWKFDEFSEILTPPLRLLNNYRIQSDIYQLYCKLES
jgi:hypothetical protein